MLDEVCKAAALLLDVAPGLPSHTRAASSSRQVAAWGRSPALLLASSPGSGMGQLKTTQAEHRFPFLIPCLSSTGFMKGQLAYAGHALSPFYETSRKYSDGMRSNEMSLHFANLKPLCKARRMLCAPW